MYNLCTETSRRGIEKVPCQKQKEKQGSYKDGRVYSAGVTFLVHEEFAFCNVLYCHLIAGGINSFSGNIRKKGGAQARLPLGLCVLMNTRISPSPFPLP